ncbi:MAG: HAD hydrolase family protein [Thermoplasmata archaeon]|nr:MAG: HAD hydrolase family protein [Thermoplasmata archaeon]
MSNVICFDLEGPLSPQDNAYEVMGLFENGHRIFEIISRYDDLLALEGKEGYEAGDTLALIAPFLVYHRITEKHVTEVSKKAMLVDGAKELISQLKETGWEVYIISTSYQQHAYNIGSQVSISPEKIHCTSFPLDSYIREFEGLDTTLIAEAEQEILELYPPINDMKVKMRLDRFFWNDMPKSPIGRVLFDMSVVGGARKVSAAERVAKEHDLDLKDIVVVGDSITDLKMLKAVNDEGGLAVAFNGNQYAIPEATIGLATTNMMDLMKILKPWKEGGREKAISSLSEYKEKKEPYIHVLVDRNDFQDIIDVHKKVRNMVRGRAAKLG